MSNNSMKPFAKVLILVAFMMFPGLVQTAMAQPYPVKPVRIVVPWPQGGTTDGPARILAQSMTRDTGQQYLVENRPGASGIVGTEVVAKSAGDGYTMLLVALSNIITQVLMKQASVDFSTGFQHTVMFATSSGVLLINPKSTIKTLPELIAVVKAKPGSLSYGSPGNGTASHLAAEMLKQAAGIDIVHVPYKAAATSITDLMGGQIELVSTGVAASVQLIKSGKVRALATLTKDRVSQLPDTPAAAEYLPGYDASSWVGISMPGGTPPALVDRISEMVRKSLEEPKSKASLIDLGVTPVYLNPREFTARIRADTERYIDVVRRAKLSVD